MTQRVETGNSGSVERVVASCEKKKEADVAEKYHDKMRDNREVRSRGREHRREKENERAHKSKRQMGS